MAALLLAMPLVASAPGAVALTDDGDLTPDVGVGGVPTTFTYHNGDTPLEPGDDEAFADLAGLRGWVTLGVLGQLDEQLGPGPSPTVGDDDASPQGGDDAADDDGPGEGPGVDHGLASLLGDLLDQAESAVPPALAPPVWPYVGPDGADVVHKGPGGWPLLGGDHLIGGDAPGQVWPCEWAWLGWGLCGDRFTLPRVLEDSSDDMLAQQLRKAGILCQGLQGHVDTPLPDCAAVLRDVAQSLLPNIRYRTDLESTSVTVDDTLARDGSGDAARTAGSEPMVAAVRGAAWPDAATPLATLPAEPEAPDAGPAGEGPRAASGSGLDPLTRPAGYQAMLPRSVFDPAVALVLGAFALTLPAWALYRRIASHRALDHPVRADLMGIVRAEPGIHESRLARRLGLRHTHVQYHLRVLTDAGLVEARPFGGLKCLFATGRLSPAEKARAMAQHGRAGEVLEVLGGTPGLTQRALARRLGMRESSVKWHLDRLEAGGYIRTERAGGAKRVWLRSDGAPPGATAHARAPAPAAARGGAGLAAAGLPPRAAAPPGSRAHASAGP